jgi:hypothetical protein
VAVEAEPCGAVLPLEQVGVPLLILVAMGNTLQANQVLALVALAVLTLVVAEGVWVFPLLLVVRVVLE